MFQLPCKIEINQNPIGASLRYFLLIIGTYAFSTFAFGGYIPYEIWIGMAVIILAIAGIVIMVKYDKNRKQTIELTQEGITLLKNGKKTFISWKEDHQGYYDGTQFHKYFVPVAQVVKTQVAAKGRNIQAHYPFAGFHDLLITLSTKGLKPLLEKRIFEGKTVYFGPLRVSAGSIYLKGREIPRHEVRGVKVENGKLVLKLSNQLFSTKILVKDIPNFSILMDILLPESGNVTAVGDSSWSQYK